MIIPYYKEAIFVADKEELFLKLLMNTLSSNEINKGHLLYDVWVGNISTHSFCISRSVHHNNLFVPKITGKIKGDILEIEYKLFPFTYFFLFFWSFVMFIAILTSMVFLKKPIYGFLFVFALILNYLIVLLNFNRQLKISRESLFSIL